MAITDSINCSCSDTTGHRTLAQLVTAVKDALGFISQQAISDVRTLTVLRAQVHRNMGYAAYATYAPGMSALIDGFINEAQQQLARRPEFGLTSAPARMSADSDNSTLDSHVVVMLATAYAKAHEEQADAKAYFERVDKYVSDMGARQPPNATQLIKGYLQSAQRQIYMRYDALRTERWFSWDLTANAKLYDFPDSEEVCSKKLNPAKLTWVGTVRDGIWDPLRCGIDPACYSHNVTGRPERYDIRQCIEVWPTPDETAGQLVIKGHFGLEAFAADADVTTIDDELVFLLATANAKAHYRQPDAQNYIAQFEMHLRKIIASTHKTNRYVPGQPTHTSSYVEPQPEVPFP